VDLGSFPTRPTFELGLGFAWAFVGAQLSVGYLYIQSDYDWRTPTVPATASLKMSGVTLTANVGYRF